MQTLAFHRYNGNIGQVEERLDSLTWVLVIHYGFQRDADLNMRRDANKLDLQLLKKIFSHYGNCVYKEMKSPSHTEISLILAERGMKEMYSHKSRKPTLFLLFILSHGGENGRILTDTKTSPPYDFFTTFQVWDALEKNKLLLNCLKINFFGPCKGTLTEIQVPVREDEIVFLGRNSTRILGQPNSDHIINFFSTVESTMANRDVTKGSWMVTSFCKQLQLLEKDVDVTEFLQRMARDIIMSKAIHVVQTPQISVFPHNKTHFCKWEGAPYREVKSETTAGGDIVPAERFDYYRWKNEHNTCFKRGHALIFAQHQTKLTEQFSDALKFLELQPKFIALHEVKQTLRSVSRNGLSENEGCILIAVFGTIRDFGIENAEYSGLAVDIGGDFVPIGDLTRNFISSKCPSFALKPKIFFILDSNNKTEGFFNKAKTSDVSKEPPGNNHAGFLVQICYGEDSIVRLTTKLKNPGLLEGKVTLQEVLLEVTCHLQNQPRVNQMWSTMSLKLDFPKCKDVYIPHMFKQDVTRSVGTMSFEQVVEVLISGEHRVFLIVAPPGMGKTRASEEIHSQLVVRLNSHFVVYRKFSQCNAYWNKVEGETTISLESFLKSCVDQRSAVDLMESLIQGKVFIILDGFDEICPNLGEVALKMLNLLIEVKVTVLITSRCQERENILRSFVPGTKAKIFKLDAFLDQQKVAMLQTNLNKSSQECKDILERFDSDIHGFSSNPLHLRMICEVSENKLLNLYQMYDQFLKDKLKHGLRTCRQVDETSVNFQTQLRNIEKKLMKSAHSLIISNNGKAMNGVEAQGAKEINWSGVATVVDEEGLIEFVHRSFAEFLLAKMFLQLVAQNIGNKRASWADVNAAEILIRASSLTIKFITFGITRCGYQDLSDSVKRSFETRLEQVLTVICRDGLSEIYTFVIERNFPLSQVVEWLKISQQKAQDRSNETEGLFVQACSHDKLATKFAECNFTIQVKNVHQVAAFIAGKNQSRVGLETFLSKVEGWHEVWPAADHVQDLISCDSLYSLEQIELLLEKCQNLALTLIGKLDEEVFCDCKYRSDLLNHLNFNPRGPQFEDGIYLEREKEKIMWYNLGNMQETFIQFGILLLRASENNGLQLFQEVEKQIPRDYKLKCGCSLVHAAMKTKSSALLLFLVEKEFSLVEVDRLGRTPLHLDNIQPDRFEVLLRCVVGEWFISLEEDMVAVRTEEEQLVVEERLGARDKFGRMVIHKAAITPNFELLVKNLLGSHFVAIDGTKSGTRNEVARRILLVRDDRGRTPLHFCYKNQNLEVLLRNLLGGIRNSGKTLAEQREIASLILQKDNTDTTALHLAVVDGTFRQVELLLRGVLGDYYVSIDGEAVKGIEQRSEEEKCFLRSVLCARDENGSTAKSLGASDVKNWLNLILNK